MADDESACLAIAESMLAAKITNARTTLLRATRDHGDPEESLANTIARLAAAARRAMHAGTLDELRGVEGDAAADYFGVLDRLVTLPDRASFRLCERLAHSLINRKQVSADGFNILENGAVRMSDQTRRTVITAYQRRKQEEITHPYLRERTTVGLIIHLQARLADIIDAETDSLCFYLLGKRMGTTHRTGRDQPVNRPGRSAHRVGLRLLPNPGEPRTRSAHPHPETFAIIVSSFTPGIYSERATPEPHRPAPAEHVREITPPTHDTTITHTVTVALSHGGAD